MSTNRKKSTGMNFLLQGSILAIAGVITKIIGIIYRVPLQRIVGDEGMGYYGIANSIYIVALTLTSYSLPLAVSKLVSARAATGHYKNAYKVFRTAMTFALLVGGFVSLLVFFGASFISTHIMQSELAIYALKVLAPCIFIVAILGTIRGFFQGMGSMIPTAISQIIEQIVNAIFSVGGAWYLLKKGTELAALKKDDSYGPAVASAGGTLGTVMGAFFALVFVLLIFMTYKKYYKKKMRRDRTRETESYGFIVQVMLATILPVIISGTINNIGDFLDSSIFNNVMSAQGVLKKDYVALLGTYTGSYATITRVPIAISTAIASSFIPSLVATVHTGTKRDVYRKINATMRFNMTLVIPCAVGFFVLAKPIMNLLFSGSNSDLAGNMLRVGAISVVFYCLSTITNSILQGIDEMMIPVKNAMIALLIYVVSLCTMLIVFKWGIYSVVFSRIVYAGSLCILNAHAIREKIGYVQDVKKIFVVPSIAAIIMGIFTALFYFLLSLFVPGTVATVIACFIAVFFYFLALVMVGGIGEKELTSIPKGVVILRILRKLHLMRD